MKRVPDPRFLGAWHYHFHIPSEICGEMTIKPIDVWRLRAWGAVIIDEQNSGRHELLYKRDDNEMTLVVTSDDDGDERLCVRSSIPIIKKLSLILNHATFFVCFFVFASAPFFDVGHSDTRRHL